MEILLLAMGVLAVVYAVKRGGSIPSGAGLGESGGGSPLSARPGPVVDTAIRETHARHPSVPLAFFYACAALESRFNPGVKRFDQIERSVGLFQINLNAWGARVTQLGFDPQDLHDPRIAAEFWAKQIVEPLAARADRESYTGDEKWYAVRSWLASPGFNPRNPDSGAQRYIARFKPVWELWKGLV